MKREMPDNPITTEYPGRGLSSRHRYLPTAYFGDGLCSGQEVDCPQSSKKVSMLWCMHSTIINFVEGSLRVDASPPERLGIEVQPDFAP